MNKEDLLTIHAVTGGIPLYLAQMDDTLPLKENLIQNFFTRNTLLYDETKNLLNQELRMPARYLAIIQAIASGKNKQNEIAQAVGLETTQLPSYFQSLLELGIIGKKYPLGEEKKGKKVQFQIKDGLFSFYYKFVPKYQVLIDRNQHELLWEIIQEELIQFTSIAFEEFCKEWLLAKNGQDIYDMILLEIGSWWGNNPFLKVAQQEEIDILAFGINHNEMLIAECKWRGELTSLDVLEKLQERAQFFGRSKKELFLFSKSGFTKEVLNRAKKDQIKLVVYKDML
jgi:AAA+ ATPase superfamily predicted ATPase